MSTSEQQQTFTPEPADKAKIKHIIKVMLILAAVTCVEFVFAFTMDKSWYLTSIFVVLTIVKAFYIVSEFMHLGHEVKSLKWSIILPMLFVVWLLVALIYEGEALHSYF